MKSVRILHLGAGLLIVGLVAGVYSSKVVDEPDQNQLQSFSKGCELISITSATDLVMINDAAVITTQGYQLKHQESIVPPSAGYEPVVEAKARAPTIIVKYLTPRIRDKDCRV